MMDTVPLLHGFVWTCPKCGAAKAEFGVIAEFSEAERTELSDQVGEVVRTGEWVTRPDEVMCVGCGIEFKAVEPCELADPQS